METTITFHISKQDKDDLIKLSKINRLSLSSWIRMLLITYLKQDREDQSQ
jgi:hypothetical protein